MSSDSLVFDMSSLSEGSPQIFVRRDWLSVLDNQNQNYQGNQVVLDTSQLANSNKYMNYREAYLLLPLMLTLTSQGIATAPFYSPATSATSSDFAVGLKNWYGSIIHSFTIDYNGTTIVQQTPYLGLWNCFKLMTSLSVDDLVNSSSQLGFYPDSPLAWSYNGGAGNQNGIGISNNNNSGSFPLVNGVFNSGEDFNKGLLRRQQAWNHDPQGLSGISNANAGNLATNLAYQTLLTSASLTTLWKSYIYNKVNGTGTAVPGVFQVAISAVVYLKHVSSFFERIPLLKGVFMKLTANLNQSSVNFTVGSAAVAAGTSISPTIVLTAAGLMTVSVAGAAPIVPGTSFTSGVAVTVVSQLSIGANGVAGGIGTYQVSAGGGTAPTAIAVAAATAMTLPAVQSNQVYSAVSVNSPLGGVSPLMLCSTINQSINNLSQGQFASGAHSAFAPGSYILSLAVGNKVLNSSQASQAGIVGSPLSGSVILNIPAYIYNPIFESSYLASPIKKICYTDIYQYQINNIVKSNSAFNNLISNGIANIKSVLVLPYFSVTQTQDNLGLSPLQSPFDPAGGGPTSPLCLFSQFNIQISGQNAIYNTERYAYEQYLNQLHGCHSINGGMTDGISSGLIDEKAFQHEYCYYYVNCGRMLPVEESVPKSVSILGVSMSVNPIDLYVFVEYGVEVSIDILTGARV